MNVVDISIKSLSRIKSRCRHEKADRAVINNYNTLLAQFGRNKSNLWPCLITVNEMDTPLFSTYKNIFKQSTCGGAPKKENTVPSVWKVMTTVVLESILEKQKNFTGTLLFHQLKPYMQKQILSPRLWHLVTWS